MRLDALACVITARLHALPDRMSGLITFNDLSKLSLDLRALARERLKAGDSTRLLEGSEPIHGTRWLGRQAAGASTSSCQVPPPEGFKVAELERPGEERAA